MLNKTAILTYLRLAGDVLIYAGLTLLAFAIPRWLLSSGR